MTGYLIPFFLPGIEIFLGDLLVIDYIGRYIGIASGLVDKILHFFQASICQPVIGRDRIALSHIAGQKEIFPWNTSYIPYRLCIRPVPG